MLKRFSKKRDNEQQNQSEFICNDTNNFAEQCQQNIKNNYFENTPYRFSKSIHKKHEQLNQDDNSFISDFSNRENEYNDILNQNEETYEKQCLNHDFNIQNSPDLFFGGKRVDLKHKKNEHEKPEKPHTKQGIDIYTNNEIISKDVDEIDFNGEYVQTNIIKNGRLGVYIGRPLGSSHFNTTNSVTDGMVIHDFELTNMIVPSIKGISDKNKKNIYGDWKPGQIVKGFNSTDNEIHKKCHTKCNFSNVITFTTKEPINLNGLNTFFKINVYDGCNNKLVSVKTQDIDCNSENLTLIGNNKHICVKMKDFAKYEQNDIYSVIPIFMIDIGEILGVNGGRFSVEIIHDNNKLELTYNSGDIFFNCGKLPTYSRFQTYVILENLDVSTKFCSGLRYILPGHGNIRYVLTRNK